MRGAERELVAHDRACVSAAEVRAGLADFGRVFAHLRPFEQKQLLRLLLRRAKLVTGNWCWKSTAGPAPPSRKPPSKRTTTRGSLRHRSGSPDRWPKAPSETFGRFNY